MSQEYKTKQTAKRAEQDQDSAPEQVEVENTDQMIDDILDEIDEVLEENAQEFVANYIQKGGE
jgi:prokaryotic ubiquitin-like protein Pup